MNGEREHVAFDTLNDYADGVLDERSMSIVSKHIESCSMCAGQYSKLQSVLEFAARLPRTLAPPDDIWPDLKEALDRRKEAVLPITAAASHTLSKADHGSPRTTRKRWQSPAFLAVAAVILVIVSSGITALVLRGDNAQRLANQYPSVRAPSRVPMPPPVLPVGFTMAEGEYSRAIGELLQAVDAERSRLSPETIRTVDRSLAAIDSAIAEARNALVADPNNATLVDLLSASYQRKLDLLRRTSELSSRI
jgi:anti-sigma factor RsiW